VIDATFCPDGRFVLTGSRDETARLWDSLSGKSIGPPLPHRGPVVRVAFTGNGETILTATQDQLTYHWPLPKAMPGTPEQIELWAQVATGMELEANGSVRILDATQWNHRSREIEQSGLLLPGMREVHR
jgi:WD40 repeat protein